jgi:hypothetical protein
MEPNIPANTDPLQPTFEPIQVPAEQNFEPTKKSLPKWPLIIVGIILILVLVGGAYFLGQKSALTTQAPKTAPNSQISHQATSTPALNSTAVTPIPTFNPTATWKTFTTQSGASFKYPTDWTPKETVTPKDSSGFGPRDGVTLTSPNGLVITYGDHGQGLGGGCDPADCPYNHVLKVEPVNIPGYGTLNLVELVVKDGNDSSVIDAQVGLIDPKTYPNLQVGSTKQFGYYVLFNDKDPNKYLDQFSVYVYDSNSKSNQMGQLSNLSQYFTDPEVITAENILKTLSF